MGFSLGLGNLPSKLLLGQLDNVSGEKFSMQFGALLKMWTLLPTIVITSAWHPRCQRGYDMLALEYSIHSTGVFSYK